MKKPYWVYMLECAGGFIYTGVAIDPDARFLEHQAGRGSRFTRMRKPLRIIGRRRYPDRGEALRVEHALKKLGPVEKRRWAAAPAVMTHYGPPPPGSAVRRRKGTTRVPAPS